MCLEDPDLSAFTLTLLSDPGSPHFSSLALGSCCSKMLDSGAAQ